MNCISLELRNNWPKPWSIAGITHDIRSLFQNTTERQRGRIVLFASSRKLITITQRKLKFMLVSGFHPFIWKYCVNCNWRIQLLRLADISNLYEYYRAHYTFLSMCAESDTKSINDKVALSWYMPGSTFFRSRDVLFSERAWCIEKQTGNYKFSPFVKMMEEQQPSVSS